jgi:WD40 repeat protein
MNYEDSKSIDVWNTATGKLEKSFLASAGGALQPIGSYPKVSADERFLAALSGGKIIVWEIGGGETPKYETAYPPEKNFQLLGFTDDSRHLRAFSKEKGRLYEAETGKLYREFSTKGAQHYVVSGDSRYAVISSLGMASIYDLEADKILHHIALRTASTQSDPDNQWLTEEQTVGRARISPNGKFVMVLGEEPIRILDAKTGDVVQTLVDPQRVTYKADGKLKSSGLATGRADWLAGGDAIYTIREDQRSALLWSTK